ncbi:MAG TPA: HEAT repeat domain-containing protein [bacterium]|nr:HEAT repeat domain-containing protein [bacterium]
MKRLIIALIIFAVSTLWAQDAKSLLKTYQRNFAIASLDVKIQVVEDAGKSDSPDMAPLYLQAVDYVLDNQALMESDPRFRRLATGAVNQIGKIAYQEAAFSVWKLFGADVETQLRISVMNSLGVIAAGVDELIENMYLWLDRQNNVYQTGTVPDLRVVAACIRALGRLGDENAFPIVFSAMNVGYSTQIADLARETLLELEGDLKDHLYTVLQNSPLLEKKQALIMALESDRLNDNEKAEIAEFGLDVGLHTGTADVLEQKIARDLRFFSNQALSSRKWSQAASLVIEHFDSTVLEFERGISDKRFLLEAIDSLGNMSVHEAAVRLIQYLVLLNSYTEKLQTYDEEIVIRVVTNLGKLGDKAAFDDLIYAQYLDYSDIVRKEARKALESLQW